MALGMPEVEDTTLAPSTDAAVDHGVVYTQPWVVALILDLVGYREEYDLSALIAVEPSCGSGAFLVEMARRLARSARSHGRSIEACAGSIVAVELDPRSASLASHATFVALASEGVDEDVARDLAASWIRVGDFLTDPEIAVVTADIVVGNPPYVRPEAMAAGKLTEYRAAYRTMRGRADLYVAFYERAIHLLRREGRLGFICADRWMLNAYGRELREFVSENAAVDVVVDMHHAEAFAEDVLAYPAITVLRRGSRGATTVGKITGGMSVEDARQLASTITLGQGNVGAGWTTVDPWHYGADPWPSGSPARIALLRDLEQRFPTLADEAVRVGIGVATGADKVFITSDAEAVEPARMLPLAIGKDTLSGRVEWSGRFLVNPWDADGKLVEIDEFPRFAAYLREHEEQLRQRHVGKKDARRWYRTIDNVDPSLTQRHKLFIPDIKGQLHPVLDAGENYPHHNLYYMVSDRWPMAALGGLMLSDVAQFFVASYSVKMSGGFFRFQAQYLRRIRIPRLEDVSVETLDELAVVFELRDVNAANTLANRLYGIDGVPS